MSRPKLKKSKKAVKAQKQKWNEGRNARRAAKYASDPDYRGEVLVANREVYRTGRKLKFRSCEKALANLTAYGTRRTLVGSRNPCVTFTTPEMAEALGGYHKAVLARWYRTNRFPEPTHAAAVGEGREEVYTLAQAKALLTVMAEHQKETLYLRASHFATIAKLFDAVGLTPPRRIG